MAPLLRTPNSSEHGPPPAYGAPDPYPVAAAYAPPTYVEIFGLVPARPVARAFPRATPAALPWVQAPLAASGRSYQDVAQLFRHAAKLIERNKPGDALDVLVAFQEHPATRDNANFQAWLAEAFMGTADKMMALPVALTGKLTPSGNGNWLCPRLQAAPLHCIAGAVGATARELHLFSLPHVQAQFAERFGGEFVPVAQARARSILDECIYRAVDYIRAAADAALSYTPAHHDSIPSVYCVSGAGHVRQAATEHCLDLNVFWQQWTVSNQTEFLLSDQAQDAMPFMTLGQL